MHEEHDNDVVITRRNMFSAPWTCSSLPLLCLSQTRRSEKELPFFIDGRERGRALDTFVNLSDISSSTCVNLCYVVYVIPFGDQ